MHKDVERGEHALFPASISEVIPEDHPARFFVEVVERLNLSVLEASYSQDHGGPGYAPKMLLTLWVYGYVNGVASSRKLGEATRMNMHFMYIANSEQPDHTTLSIFRKQHQTAFTQAAGEVLQIAMDAGVLKRRQLAVDGTKLKAYAAREMRQTAKQARQRIDACQEWMDRLQAQSDRADEEESTTATRSSRVKVTLSELAKLIAKLDINFSEALSRA